MPSLCKDKCDKERLRNPKKLLECLKKCEYEYRYINGYKPKTMEEYVWRKKHTLFSTGEIKRN